MPTRPKYRIYGMIKNNIYVRGSHIKEGDVIYYDKSNGSGVRFNDKMYYVIRSRDVVLVE